MVYNIIFHTFMREKNQKIIQLFFIQLSNSWFSFPLVFAKQKIFFTRNKLNNCKANKLIHLSFSFSF